MGNRMKAEKLSQRDVQNYREKDIVQEKQRRGKGVSCF